MAGLAGTMVSGAKALIKAIDYQNGKIRWTQRHWRSRASTGVLTTDSGFSSRSPETSSGSILALDTSDGKTLWHAGTGSDIASSPITYELDHRQYVLTGSGGVLFAWSLPESGK